MSVETDGDGDATEAETGPEHDVEALGRELGEAIRELPEYERYEEAERAVAESAEAQAKIEEFEDMRQEFMVARQTGQATQEDLRELQQAQEELHAIPVMSEYLQAQNDLDARLERVNEAISDPLSIDFGEEAGGCCADD